jgi:hypothetical protein
MYRAGFALNSCQLTLELLLQMKATHALFCG